MICPSLSNFSEKMRCEWFLFELEVLSLNRRLGTSGRWKCVKKEAQNIRIESERCNDSAKEEAVYDINRILCCIWIYTVWEYSLTKSRRAGISTTITTIVIAFWVVM